MNLRIPGPTPCRQEVLSAVARPMMNHRGPEMRELLNGLIDKMAALSRDVPRHCVVDGERNGRARGHYLQPDERGRSGPRCEFGCLRREVLPDRRGLWRRREAARGRSGAGRSSPICCAPLCAKRRASKPCSSRRTRLPPGSRIQSKSSVGSSPRNAPKRSCWSTRSRALGAMPLPMDELGIDVVVTGSQKAWGVPPGMTMLCLSARAWDTTETASMPRFYFDLKRYRDAQATGSFPFTPVLPVVFGLDVALDLMLAETPAAVHARHRAVAERAARVSRTWGSSSRR